MTPVRSSVVLRMCDKIGNFVHLLVTFLSSFAVAFAQQNSCVMKSTYSSNVPENVAAGMAMGTVIVLLFCGYSLGISYDAKLILEKGYTCTGAQVMNVIFVVLIGLLASGQASPSMREFAGGQAAVYKILETINREPKIDAYSTTVSHALRSASCFLLPVHVSRARKCIT
ncbi:ABC transporter B family member 9 isoform X1 [Oryza sativa Japonica Group]|jgi:hypothetical protein|uniref:ABC transporter B family member 9 isoform X1 n=1 Tax=Oryza sativa subsp. japonica TaxID=39947 RepID=UPI00077549B0|nr:ABC transporter B family member 9 isoform X1 [Oryza sativa Japonica Group]XP_025881618.1 ABC transporter B family member 9 isoform X1 [Oryza sativa Japonica Group]XP_025881619.1 ABC transporter B family member 9 isoform X1 [Oryza sativa Japonica Group]XP_025881620.1 ABC transporter B family member 9 isoform X1 [Oryza sativa Japonica Group]XP_025881622.1 ABC transporter B family member 9 isoform X1 [Oryza sativa Japonica Group]KAF2950312.1 hypothetical protein DAI22_01g187800 [Oryza sativa J